MPGGRVPEKIIFGVAGSGAENDLQQVALLARSMISRCRMSAKLSPVAYRREQDYPFPAREGIVRTSME